MPSAGIADIKYGFYMGLGVVLAIALWTAIQMLIGKATAHG